MAVATNALPDVTDALAAPYWAAAHEHRLVMQQCSDCGFIRWAPAEQCPRCLSQAAEWVDLSGRGTIYSYVVYRRSLNPDFVDVPFTVVQVELEEGPIMITRLLEEPERAAIGAPVHVVFTEETDEVTLPNFALS